jgi:hypothetical protein
MHKASDESKPEIDKRDFTVLGRITCLREAVSYWQFVCAHSKHYQQHKDFWEDPRSVLRAYATGNRAWFPRVHAVAKLLDSAVAEHAEPIFQWMLAERIAGADSIGILVELSRPQVPGRSHKLFAEVGQALLRASAYARALPHGAVGPQATPRIVVHLGQQTIAVDGSIFEVGSESALRWVRVLAQHPGEWISAAQLEKYDGDLIAVRTDRLRRELPAAVAGLIESEVAKGSRIKVAQCGK